MTVIAMTYEIGTQGRQIASELAVRLGIDFADDQFLERRIADRLMHGKGRVGTWAQQARNVDDWTLARRATDEIMELSAYGNVLIRGWGAASLLRGKAHVIRVRVCAPASFRLRVLAERYPAQDDAALRWLIKHSDACLASNLEPVLGPDWQSDDLYHLKIDAQEMPVSSSVDVLERLIEARTRIMVEPQSGLHPY